MSANQYDPASFHREMRKNRAEEEAKRLFPTPGGGGAYDLNHIAKVREVFDKRKDLVSREISKR